MTNILLFAKFKMKFAKSHFCSPNTRLCSPSHSQVRQLKLGSPTQNSPNCSPSRPDPTNYLSHINLTFQLQSQLLNCNDSFQVKSNLSSQNLHQSLSNFGPNFPISFFQFQIGLTNLKLSHFSFFQLPFSTTCIPGGFTVKRCSGVVLVMYCGVV